MRPLSAIAGIAVLLLSLTCMEARADIFKWIDDQGTMHFTDDPSSIPPAKRNHSASPFIKEQATSAEPAKASPAPVTIQAAGPETVSPESGENGTEALQREIEQLKAKISAKESLIQAVDAKRSLAMNPLRNRNVSAADMDLYEKYKSEIREDHERLLAMEAKLKGTR